MSKKATMVIAFDIDLDEDDTSLDEGSEEPFDWIYYLDSYVEASLLSAEITDDGND